MLFTVQSISFVFMINANSLTLLIILPSDTPCRKYYLCICLKTPTFSFVSFRPHFYSPHLSSSFTLYSSHVLSLVGCIAFSTEEKTITPDWFIYWVVFLRKKTAETLEFRLDDSQQFFNFLDSFSNCIVLKELNTSSPSQICGHLFLKSLISVNIDMYRIHRQ